MKFISILLFTKIELRIYLVTVGKKIVYIVVNQIKIPVEKNIQDDKNKPVGKTQDSIQGT